MSGIIGAINIADNSKGNPALTCLAHRMPNKQSVFEFDGGYLQGDHGIPHEQPWHRNQWLLVADIDIFDVQDVVSKLQAAGVAYDADSYGDLLLAGWELLGGELFNHIEADFALALINTKTLQLVLVRDRFGTRPLYYYQQQSQAFFASEYKAIIQQQPESARVDVDILQYLHSRKTVPADRTLMQEIYQVPPQSYVIINTDGTKSIHRYWQPTLSLRNNSLEYFSNRLAAAFLGAVGKRIHHDLPVIVSLSGGIDSIAILGAVRHLEPERTVHTFTVGDNNQDPELVWAEKVAKYYGTQHYPIVLKADILAESLPKLAWHLEDPIARTETLMGYVLAQAASKVGRIILRGDGADGLFGGMPRHTLVARAQRWPFIRFFVDPLYGFTQTGVLPQNPVTGLAIKTLLGRKIPSYPHVAGARGLTYKTQLPPAGKELLNRLLVSSPLQALPMLLQKMERVHAAFGMRCISPFLDQQVVELAYQIPSKFKNDGNNDKIVLREAVAGFVPDEFRSRPKHPQRIKEDRAFCDQLETVARSLLTHDLVTAKGLYSWDEIRRLLDRRGSRPWRAEHAMRIWTLVLSEERDRLFSIREDNGHTRT